MTSRANHDRCSATDADWDAVVIGAGPAGAMAARELARRRVRVLLVERKVFPRSKVCGACLNQRAVSCLEKAGLVDLLPRLRAVPTRHFRACCGGRNVQVDLPGGAAVSREALDDSLVRAAADAGAEFLPGTAATLRDAHIDCSVREVELSRSQQKPRTVRAKVILAADGLGNPALGHSPEFETRVAPEAKIGVRARIVATPQSFEAGTIYMAVARGGYVGLVGVEDGGWNLAAAIGLAALRQAGSPAAAVAAILSEAGLPQLCLPAGGWQGTPPLTQRIVRPVGYRTFVLGDAAGYVEPFTGEGIAWALESGIAVAPLAVRGLEEWSRDIEHDWLRAHRRLVRDRQFWCRAFAALLRYPSLVRVAASLACAWPAACRSIVSSLNRPPRAPEV